MGVDVDKVLILQCLKCNEIYCLNYFTEFFDLLMLTSI